MTLEKSMLEYLRSMRSSVFVLLLVLSVIALTIPLGVRAQEQIVAGYDGHAGFQGPLWAAKDLGLFDKYGLTAELVLIPGSARGMAALTRQRPMRRVRDRPAVGAVARRRRWWWLPP
jgi:hypothetical protein